MSFEAVPVPSRVLYTQGVSYEFYESLGTVTAVLLDADFIFHKSHGDLHVSTLRIGPHIDTIKRDCIAYCDFLYRLDFWDQSCLFAIDGFEGCAFESLDLPESVSALLGSWTAPSYTPFGSPFAAESIELMDSEATFHLHS
jgi:hypothetical protein